MAVLVALIGVNYVLRSTQSAERIVWNGVSEQLAGREAAARTAFAQACEAGDAKGCRLLGESYVGSGDLKVARKPLEQACELRSGKACHLLANFHDSQTFGARDPMRAAELYARACKLKAHEACGAAEELAVQVLLDAFPEDEDGVALRRLAQAGSNLSKPHDADFLVNVSDERSARSAASALEQEGFVVRVVRGKKATPWLCVATKSIIPAHAALLELRARLQALAAEHRGTYDGWEMPIVH